MIPRWAKGVLIFGGLAAAGYVVWKIYNAKKQAELAQGSQPRTITVPVMNYGQIPKQRVAGW